MTEHELSLLNKNLNEMSPEDGQRIMHKLAHAKRVVDITSLIPGSGEEYLKDKQAFLDKYGIDLTTEDVDFLIAPSDPKEKLAIISDPKRVLQMPESFFRYRQFIGNKIAFRNLMIEKLCVPENAKMKKWRQRQIKRCNGALGGLNEAFVHTVITYELATGCSVGCPFCGLDAGPLQKLFRYTPENTKLFRDVLKVCHEVLGDAAGQGMMYFATEPLDNPDYEKFENDFYEEFRCVPQITTAVPDRDIERTRRLVAELSNGRGFIHRFTIRSARMAEEILDKFTPEELVMVELLPQFPEAPAFVPYVKVGRETEDTDTPIADGDPGTICCVDGFCVNFADKRFKLVSPERVSEVYPKGIYESEWIGFDDADDLKEKLTAYIDNELEQDIPKDRPLKMYDHLSVGKYKGKDAIISKYGEIIPMGEPYMIKVAELLTEGAKTREEIVKFITSEGNVPAENVFWYLNRLWDGGCIVEKMFEK